MPTSRNWVVEAVTQVQHELVLYARTVIGITFRPRRFVLAWMRGEAVAMNPLGFLAATLAAIGFCDGLYAFVTPPSSTPSRPNLYADVAQWAAPFVYYVLFGLFVWLLLRLFRSGAQLLDALAVTLYAGGGPASLGGLAFKAVMLVYMAISRRSGIEETTHDPRWTTVLALVPVFLPYVAFCISLGAGMRAISASRIRAWHVVPAVIFAVLVAGFAFGTFAPAGEYGFHPVFTLLPDADGQHTLNVGFSS